MAFSVGGTHDVRIGTDYFLLRPGSYRQRNAPLFGARFATGDPDFNNLSFWQHWAQTCWVGGFGAPTWRDDAMFDEGVGIDATQHEVMVLSRDLGPADRATGNWDLNGEALIRIFTTYNGKLYALQTNHPTQSRLYRLDDASATWILVKTFTENVVWFEQFGSYLVFGDAGATITRMNTAEAFSTVAKPGGVTSVAYTLRAFRGHLYFGFGNQIWRMKGDFTWDGGTVFYTAEGVNYLNQSEVHLGFLYFASRNGHILRTDGNNTFDLWAFEPYVTIWGIRSFDGRLFVGAAEELDGTTSQQTVLYQFSGAAVTELKRWGKVGYDTTPGKLRAIGKRLYFGASNLLGMGSVDGFGIACYDPVEDAYHLFASNQALAYAPGTEGVNTTVDDVYFHKGYIYCSVRGYGIFRTKFSYKDVTRYQATYDTTAQGAAPGSKNGGWYESSDFDAGTPGLLKLFREMTVHVDLPSAACTVFVEGSTDGGGTWFDIGTVSKTGAATRYATKFVLQNPVNTPLTGTRLKYRVTLRTTDSTRTPQLRGVIVSYLPIPEPNWIWDMVLVLSEQQLLHDETIATPDLDAIIGRLKDAFRDGTLVEFQDIDGTIWAGAGQVGVLITDMDITPVPLVSSGAGQREYEVRVVLHEAVESY